MDKHTYSDIYDAGGKELVAFAKLFEHKKSCGVCMLEKDSLFPCSEAKTLLHAWEITEFESLKVVLDATR